MKVVHLRAGERLEEAGLRGERQQQVGELDLAVGELQPVRRVDSSDRFPFEHAAPHEVAQDLAGSADLLVVLAFLRVQPVEEQLRLLPAFVAGLRGYHLSPVRASAIGLPLRLQQRRDAALALHELRDRLVCLLVVRNRQIVLTAIDVPGGAGVERTDLAAMRLGQRGQIPQNHQARLHVVDVVRPGREPAVLGQQFRCFVGTSLRLGTRSEVEQQGWIGRQRGLQQLHLRAQVRGWCFRSIVVIVV